MWSRLQLYYAVCRFASVAEVIKYPLYFVIMFRLEKQLQGSTNCDDCQPTINLLDISNAYSGAIDEQFACAMPTFILDYLEQLQVQQPKRQQTIGVYGWTSAHTDIEYLVMSVILTLDKYGWHQHNRQFINELADFETITDFYRYKFPVRDSDFIDRTSYQLLQHAWATSWREHSGHIGYDPETDSYRWLPSPAVSVASIGGPTVGNEQSPPVTTITTATTSSSDDVVHKAATVDDNSHSASSNRNDYTLVFVYHNGQPLMAANVTGTSTTDRHSTLGLEDSTS